MIAALLASAWCFVAAARNQWIDLTHLIALIVVEVGVLVQGVVAVVALASGDRPVEFATFVGYLVFFVVMLPLSVALSYLEPTRWGAVIAGVGAVTVAVLTLRLQQVWGPLQ